MMWPLLLHTSEDVTYQPTISIAINLGHKNAPVDLMVCIVLQIHSKLKVLCNTRWSIDKVL